MYRGWWSESEGSTEARCLEIVRLALLGGEAEIAGKIGDRVATGWVNNSRFVEALDLCQRILAVFTDHRILQAIARAEVVLGNVEDATKHYTQALAHCPEDDFKVRSGILFNHATLIAQQGDIDRALDLWQQSLESYERIGDVQGKAATLANMGANAYKQGDIQRAAELLQQSAQALGQIRAYTDLVTALSNLDIITEKGNLTYLAQAVWLCLRVQSPLTEVLSILRDLFNAVPQSDPLEALLAAYALYLCAQRGATHPQLPQLQDLSGQMMAGAANAQRIATQEAFDTWFSQQQLNDPAAYLPRLNHHLETLIGDGWAFDPTPLQSRP